MCLHAIRERASRAVASTPDEWRDLRNSGPVAEAGDALVRMLDSALARIK